MLNNLRKRVQEVELALKSAQSLPVPEENCNLCVGLERDVDELNEKHETYWYLRNTKCFTIKLCNDNVGTRLKVLWMGIGCGRLKNMTLNVLLVAILRTFLAPQTHPCRPPTQEALVKEGIMWRDGNGNATKAWTDPWLVDDDGRFATSPPVDSITMDDFSFNDRDLRCIISIPISSRLPKDEVLWDFSKEGGYTVKSAYCWARDVCPKARHFLWRLCTRTLLVLNLLKSRHLIEDTACPWYGKDEESWEHAFIVKDSCLLNACELVASWRIVNVKTKQRGRGGSSIFNVGYMAELTTPDSVLLARVDRWVEEHEAYTKAIYSTI
ncbi:hypothetical protein RDABS01_000570 [Bienertia sinuspersici]